MPSSSLLPLLAFFAVVALIPIALWLLRRSGYVGNAGQDGLLRTVASHSLSPSQRVVVIELMQGAASRWLVLGVTAEQITTLTTLDAPAEVPEIIHTPHATSVSQLIARWRKGHGGDAADSRGHHGS